MKLYLHNFLQDNLGDVPQYPLRIHAGEVNFEASVDFNADLITSFTKRIDFAALAAACADLGQEFQMPPNLDDLDEEQLHYLHHWLFEVEVMSGELVSPSGRTFPIISGIPDMCPHLKEGPPEGEAEPAEDAPE
jgi:uncharacterized protein YbaR (Trm112 family)